MRAIVVFSSGLVAAATSSSCTAGPAALRVGRAGRTAHVAQATGLGMWWLFARASRLMPRAPGVA
jgi:hypothetical protein